MEEFGSHWTNFREILYWGEGGGEITEICWGNSSLVKIGQTITGILYEDLRRFMTAEVADVTMVGFESNR
jgi:hypothetical protein